MLVVVCTDLPGRVSVYIRLAYHAQRYVMDATLRDHTFANEDAFIPCILKLCTLFVITVAEPISTRSTTTSLSIFVKAFTFGAHERSCGGGGCAGQCCTCVSLCV